MLLRSILAVALLLGACVAPSSMDPVPSVGKTSLPGLDDGAPTAEAASQPEGDNATAVAGESAVPPAAQAPSSVSLGVVDFTPPPPPSPGQEAIAYVNGSAITGAALAGDLREELREIDNEHAQRRLHSIWLALERQIDRRLFAAAAAADGISEERYLEQRLSTILPPSDDELRRVYDDNREVLGGVSFEEARDSLSAHLSGQQRQEAFSRVSGELRERARIDYALPIPKLPRFDVDISGAPFTGPEDAAVTVVEFSDFECPYCARGRALVHHLRETWPDDVRVVFMDFPLQQHTRAIPAAVAAFCAGEQGLFWPYHDLLFDHQPAFDDASLKRYGALLELDAEDFEQCRATARAAASVTSDIEAGRRLGIEGTPTLFINGIKLIGLLPLPLIRGIIAAELDGYEGARHGAKAAAAAR